MLVTSAALTAAAFGPEVSSAATGPTVVHPSGIGPSGPWIRLQDDPSNAGRTPGVQEIAAKSDPVRYDGSLHLAVKDGQQSQVAHYSTSPRSLSALLGKGISYYAYLNSSGSTLTEYGPNLQFPMICKGRFTTLSFEPRNNPDTTGRTGMAPDTWQRFSVTSDSTIRTSREVAGVAPAGGSAPMRDFVAGCTGTGDGAVGVIANVGTLGSTASTLDTYVDLIDFAGTTYDFAVTGRATATLSVPPALRAGGPAGRGEARYTDPGDGPEYPGTSTLLTLRGPKGLRPQHLKLTHQGRVVRFTQRPDGSLAAYLDNAVRAGATLNPRGRVGAPFTLAATANAPGGRLTARAELTVTSPSGRRIGTGVYATDTSRIVARPPVGPVDTGRSGTAREAAGAR